MISNLVENKGNSPLYWASTAVWIATVLQGLFGEYHSSAAALGQQRQEVIKQPLVRDWLATPETVIMLNLHRSKYRGRFVQGWIKYSKEIWLDYSLWGAVDEKSYSLKRPSNKWQSNTAVKAQYRGESPLFSTIFYIRIISARQN